MARTATSIAARLACAVALTLTLGACAAGPWERAATSHAEMEAELARCVARENANARTFQIAQPYRTRDGRTELLFFPHRYVDPGFDRESCMRAQGFVRAAKPPPA